MYHFRRGTVFLWFHDYVGVVHLNHHHYVLVALARSHGEVSCLIAVDLLTHISKIPSWTFVKADVTPVLRFQWIIFLAGRIFVKYHLQNMLWYVTVLSKYSLFLLRVICLEGALFFTGGALIVPRSNKLGYEGFTLLSDAKLRASWTFTKVNSSWFWGYSKTSHIAGTWQR